jgi:CRISPR-associated protein Csx10
MNHFALNLTAVSPLAIRADHAPDGVASASYIAGSALVGSLAATYRLFHNDSAETFEDLFLRERVLYPNLYPATFENAYIQNAQAQPVYPSPLTARTCKRHEGFRDSPDDGFGDERHGVRDSLFDRALFKLARKANNGRNTDKLLKILDSQKDCKVCGKPMKHFSAFYRRNPQKAEQMMVATAHTRVQTHTGINRATGTVQEGILYSREVFQEQTRFWGMVKVPEELAERFTDFVRQVGKSGLLRIGTGRSRGLGKVELSALPLDEEPYGFEAFRQRLQAFDRAFQEQAEKIKQAQKIELALEPGHFYFALTLHAPAILRDELLRYRGSLDKRTLAELMKSAELPADSFQEIYLAAETRRVTGWNELWGTPRVHEFAIGTGSVFFFASRIGANETLLRELFRLEQEGIGQRRAEGFGRLCVSDPFHLEVELR